MPGTRSQRAKSAASAKSQPKTPAGKRGGKQPIMNQPEPTKAKGKGKQVTKASATKKATSEVDSKVVKSTVQNLGKKRTAQAITKPEKEETKKSDNTVDKSLKKNDGKVVTKQVKVKTTPTRS